MGPSFSFYRPFGFMLGPSSVSFQHIFGPVERLGNGGNYFHRRIGAPQGVLHLVHGSPRICITSQSMSSLVDNVHLLFGKCLICLSVKVFFPLFYTDHLEDLLSGMHTSVLMMLQCVNAGGFMCQSLKYTHISSTGLQLVGNHRKLL